jgi:hypothetical protein
MPAKNHLNPKQIEKIQKVLRESEKANIRKKIRFYYCSMTAKGNLKWLIFWVAQSTKYLISV